MEPAHETFGTTLATTALQRDWAGVHALLAPWLRARLSVAEVQAFFEDDYRQLLTGLGIEELQYPALPYVSGNSSDLAFLREPISWKNASRPIPAEVTAENFRQWMTIQLQCSEEQQETLECDFLTEFWFVLVQLDEGYRVGYWAHDPYHTA